MSSDAHLEAAREGGPVAGWKPVESITLEQAQYCVNCDLITNVTQAAVRGTCAVCGSDSVLNLARALFREGEAVA